MDKLFRDLTIAFAAGALGALANSLTVWIFGELGITAAAGVKVAPALTAGWLYPRRDLGLFARASVVAQELGG